MQIRSWLLIVILVSGTTDAFAQCVTGVETDILTHWSTATNSFSLGATGQVPFATSPNGSSPSYYWGPQFLPEYGNYVANNYASRAIPLAQASAWVNHLAAEFGGLPFRVYNPYIGNLAARLAYYQPCVQIIPGLIIGNSIAAVILPPYWPSGGPFPIVVNSQYDVNENLFSGTPGAVPPSSRPYGQQLMNWIAQSAHPGTGRTGAIGIVWNGGASVSSVTADINARAQFRQVIDWAAANAGGDRNRIIMFGGSRGGVATLMIASNPEGLPYTVKYAVAQVPGTRLGTSTELISAMLPAQLGIGWSQTGFADSWRPGWTYPAFGRPSLVGLNAPAAMRKLISGSTDIGFVDYWNSPIGAPFITGLKNAGTQVLLGLGSHDEFVPFGPELEYLLALKAAQVPVEASIIFRGGHSGAPNLIRPAAPAPASTLIERAFWAMLSYVTPGAVPETVATGADSIVYWAVDAAGQPYHLSGLNANSEIPFTLQVPRTMYGGMPFVMMVAGQPGTQYQIYTNVAAPVTGTIPPSGWYHYTAMTGAGGTILYTVVSKRPSEPAFIQRTMQPGAVQGALTTTVSGLPIPNINGETLWNRLKNFCAPPSPVPPHPDFPCFTPAGSYGQVGWGVSEY